MSFVEVTPLTINVTTEDIEAASNTPMTTSLVIAMKRLNEARALPGQEPGEQVSQNVFQTTISPRTFNGPLVNVIDVFCATRVYSLDTNSTLIILLELLSFKPTIAYTATLTHG